MIAIRLKNVGKYFNISEQSEGFIQNFLSQTHIKKKRFWSLKDISFNIKKGECIGIIGENGSGKSTLLKIIAQIMKPSEGDITLNGKIGSFLELGVSFHRELSGKDNILFYGALSGIDKEELDKLEGQIISFSELGKKIEQPIKNYSSGMLARLSFSALAFANPDIFLIDEVTSVGDYSFRQKIKNKLLELKRRGKTALIASHDMEFVSNFCDKCILLEKGRIKLVGSTERVIRFYVTKLNKKNRLKLLEKIKKEESRSCNSIQLLHLYNELYITLDNMVILDEKKVSRHMDKNSTIRAYRDLIAHCEEKVSMLKKMLDYCKKENSKAYLSDTYKDLVNALGYLQDFYDDYYLFGDNNPNNIKRIEICNELIEILKEILSPYKFLYSHRELIRFRRKLSGTLLKRSRLNKKKELNRLKRNL